ncbi:hypothetical protein ACIBEJ_50570 [Nonomuraea sp. NPDC050790]|uniref:hypothetical protein n=1 Tax=Nonomuraea sp. NPDC050790 TaxID=3364371 RepID=UPI0037880635
MLKRIIVGAAIAASAFAVTGTVTSQAASASTQPSCAVASTSQLTTSAAKPKCKWRWDKHDRKCWYCWKHHRWVKQWCKDRKHH